MSGEVNLGGSSDPPQVSIRFIQVGGHLPHSRPPMWAMVDEEDYDRINQFTWSPAGKGQKIYPQRRTRLDGKIVFVYMHWEVLGIPFGPHTLDTDHLNHDRFDNRKTNLRVVPHSWNQQNRCGPDRDNRFSPYRGVSWQKNHRKWQVQVKVNGKNNHLGLFNNIEEANRVATEFRLAHQPGTFS